MPNSSVTFISLIRVFIKSMSVVLSFKTIITLCENHIYFIVDVFAKLNQLLPLILLSQLVGNDSEVHHRCCSAPFAPHGFQGISESGNLATPHG